MSEEEDIAEQFNDIMRGFDKKKKPKSKKMKSEKSDNHEVEIKIIKGKAKQALKHLGNEIPPEALEEILEKIEDVMGSIDGDFKNAIKKYKAVDKKLGRVVATIIKSIPESLLEKNILGEDALDAKPEIHQLVMSIIAFLYAKKFITLTGRSIEDMLDEEDE